MTKNGWKSMDTAPKDGTSILILAADKEVFVGCWCRNQWELYGAHVQIYPVRKWHPLPALPEN